MTIHRAVCGHDCPDMCSLRVTVAAGRIQRIQGDPADRFTAGFICAKVAREADIIHSPQRILTPLRRVGPKGRGDFVPISWDAALAEIADRWREIIAQSGPEAILGYAYSAHQGLLNRHLIAGLFHALGATRLRSGTVCDSCSETAWELTVGPVGGTDPEDILQADLIIAWGCDVMAINVHLFALIEQARRAGVPFVVIDPRRSRTARAADWHLPLRIGTDAALACGIAHILVRDGLIDRDYVEAHTFGFDRWAREVLPAFPPARVAAITGLAEAEIERLAALYGTSPRAFIRLGGGMTRLAQGGQAVRAIATLPALTGAYGRRGGGALLSTAAAFRPFIKWLAEPGGPKPRREVLHHALGAALENLCDPPLRALFIAANNPAVTNPDLNRLRRALAREDLFTVVHDPFLSVTARYADLVLPAATFLESGDLYRSYGSYRVQYAEAVLPPPGQAWSGFRLAQALAQALGIPEAIFRLPAKTIISRLLCAEVEGPLATLDVQTLLSGQPIKLVRPAGQSFATASGRLEIFSERLAANGLPPLPIWQEDPAEMADQARYPLRLLTAPGYFQAHTSYAASAFLRQREGEPIAILHPIEGAQRGLTSGQSIRLFNQHGDVVLRLLLSEEIAPGIVLVPGGRSDEDPGRGTVNMLTDDRCSDIGEGACYHSTFVDIAPAE